MLRSTIQMAWTLLACGLLVVGAGCPKEEVKVQEKPPAEVTVVTVAAKDVPVSFQYVAQTESSHEVEIRARVPGFLDKRVYTEGSMVKAGDILFQMDPSPSRRRWTTRPPGSLGPRRRWRRRA